MKLTRKLDLAVKVGASIGSLPMTACALVFEADRIVRIHKARKAQS